MKNIKAVMFVRFLQIVALLAIAGVVLLFDLGFNDIGYFMSGSFLVLVGVFMSSAVSKNWTIISSLVVMGIYFMARGAGFISHDFLRYGLVALLLILACMYFYAALREYEQRMK